MRGRLRRRRSEWIYRLGRRRLGQEQSRAERRGPTRQPYGGPPRRSGCFPAEPYPPGGPAESIKQQVGREGPGPIEQQSDGSLSFRVATRLGAGHPRNMWKNAHNPVHNPLENPVRMVNMERSRRRS